MTDDEPRPTDDDSRDINHYLEGSPIRVGLVASFFCPPSDVNEVALVEAYERYAARYGRHIVSFSESDTDQGRPFDQRALQFPRTRQAGRLRGSLVWSASAEESRELPSAWCFRSGLARESRVLEKLWWTVDPRIETDEVFKEVFLDFSRTLPCRHAYGGLGIVQPLHPIAEQESEPVAVQVAARFHGLDVLGASRTSIDATAGIKCVNWLTLLDDTLLAKLGGKGRLRNTLSDSIVFHDIPNGVVIQAGAAPVLGDVHGPDQLAPYREVALALKPIFATGPYGEFRAMDGFQQYTNEWRHRFFPGAKWPP